MAIEPPARGREEGGPNRLGAPPPNLEPDSDGGSPSLSGRDVITVLQLNSEASPTPSRSPSS
ncbi:hypothetical protein CRG98_013187 [Punica granatum]|uniref:Uncharacterized protein n=1 Tax=Punica granatum TaxID=22663 RepID=A0A2I0KCX7_PUNGR|nr:hypothetical protein CRG98_013187 [Punica granatum]